MSEQNGRPIRTLKQYKTSVVVLECVVPEDFTQTSSTGEPSGKTKLMKELERLFNAGDQFRTGPGGALLAGMFVRTEEHGVLEPKLEQLRREYQLEQLEEPTDASERPEDALRRYATELQRLSEWLAEHNVVYGLGPEYVVDKVIEILESSNGR